MYRRATKGTAQAEILRRNASILQVGPGPEQMLYYHFIDLMWENFSPRPKALIPASSQTTKTTAIGTREFRKLLSHKHKLELRLIEGQERIG